MDNKDARVMRKMERVMTYMRKMHNQEESFVRKNVIQTMIDVLDDFYNEIKTKDGRSFSAYEREINKIESDTLELIKTWGYKI